MDNNFDVKIGQMPPISQVENRNQQVQQGDGSFQFTLLSTIEETALAERLSGLLTDIEKEGKKIAKHMDVRDMPGNEQFQRIHRPQLQPIATHTDPKHTTADMDLLRTIGEDPFMILHP